MSTLPMFQILRPFAAAVTVDVTETGGGGASASNLAVIASTPGGLYLSTASTGILASMKAALDASALNATYTLALSVTTGKVTISAAGGSVTAFALTWDDTTLRDDLGFTGNLSGAASYEATNACKLVFLPSCNRIEGPVVTGADTGWNNQDDMGSHSQSPTGPSVYHTDGYVDRTSFTFTHLYGYKTFTSLETTTNESAQTFWKTLRQYGMIARYHWDRSDVTSYLSCKMQWPRFAPAGSGTPVPGGGALMLNSLTWEATRWTTG